MSITKDKNYLISMEAGTGHACQLSVALRKYINLNSIYFFKSEFGLDYIDSEANIGFLLPQEGNILIIVSSQALDAIYNYFGESYFSRFNRVTVILTDSSFMAEHERINAMIAEFEVFATNCKMQYREGFPTKVYYQPFELSVDIVKNKKVTACHSPFATSSKKSKGTETIISTFNEIGVDYDLITGVKWEECIERKSRCDIFVDQIEHVAGDKGIPENWIGGIGKSGLEAMLLNCAVISRMNAKDYDIPAPPIILCDKDNFKEKLIFYINNESERNNIINKQRLWADKYLSPDFCAKRILGYEHM